MDFKNLRWAAVGVAFALFAALDLLVLLLTPGSERGVALLPPTVAGLIVVFTLPWILALFEKQQDQIERQGREIVTHHAMHTAIAAEMELGSLLDVAARQATLALDAEHGGIVLEDDMGRSGAEAYFNTPADQRAVFRALVREGAAGEDHREIARVPLHGNGAVLGYLAVGKSKPCAAFTHGDLTLLTALAETVVVAVANARALEAAREGERKAGRLAEVERELVRERGIAQALQEGLLSEVPERCGPFALSKRYEAQSPEAEVGGDIYDLFPLGAGRWGIVIADVSGKGLAAAQKTAMVKYALRSYAREHASPANVITRLNDGLFDEPDLTGFVTLVYGVLCEEDGSFTYASAGHETPLLRRAHGGIEALAPTGLVLGALRDMEYEEATVTLHPGDGLLLFTDGLSEARSPAGEFLEVAGLAQMLAARRDCPPGDLADALLSAVRAYAGGRLSDDAAALWIEHVA